MNGRMHILWLATACLLGVAGIAAGATRELRMATWNLEWLMEPRVLRALRASCVRDGELPRGPLRIIPCNVALSKERSNADFAALARYARRLDADVIALQEVDGPGPARRVFPNHDFCFSRRPHVQNLGFAIRRGLRFRCDGDFERLSLEGSVRPGVQVTLLPGTANEMTLLSVHLKSGCSRDPLDSGRPECGTLARQVPILERWIDDQAAAGRRFAVLGDFNRQLKRDTGPARNAEGAVRSLWAEIDDGEPAGADLTLSADLGEFRNCSLAYNASGFIDHVVLGRDLAARLVPQSFRRITFENTDAAARRLSDHCPVGLSVALQ